MLMYVCTSLSSDGGGASAHVSVGRAASGGIQNSPSSVLSGFLWWSGTYIHGVEWVSGLASRGRTVDARCGSAGGGAHMYLEYNWRYLSTLSRWNARDRFDSDFGSESLLLLLLLVVVVFSTQPSGMCVC